MITSWRCALRRVAGLSAVALLGGCASGAGTPNLWLDDPQVQAGWRIVNRQCAGCHATSDIAVSPYRPAPPFWSLRIAHNAASLQEAAAHAASGKFTMPSIILTQGEAEQVVAYMRAATEADPATRRQLRARSCIAMAC